MRNNLNQMDWFFSTTAPAAAAPGSGIVTAEAPRLYDRPSSGFDRFLAFFMGRQGAAQAYAPPVQAYAPTPAAPAAPAPQTLVMPGLPTAGGTVVQGTPNLTQREVLSTPGQDMFTRSSDAPDANLRWDDWRRLATLLPPDFNEAKYLAKNPDVADAVRKKVIPSGAWHYVMRGMPNCQQKEKAGKSCEARSMAGWRGLSGYGKPTRRPGYLAGYSPWR